MTLAGKFGIAMLLSGWLGTATPHLAAQKARASGGKPAEQSAPAKNPHAKSKAEFDAYQAAVSLSDPALLESAAIEFAQRYPASQLRAFLFQRAMGLYQQANNPGKTLEMARGVLKYDPANPLALLGAAQVLAEQTHDEDLDRIERLQEAVVDGQAALQHAGELMRPVDLGAEQFADAVAQLRRTAHEVLATAAYKKRDFRQAIAEYNAAIELDKEPVEAAVWLRMAAAYEKLDEFSQGIGAADKAIAASESGSPVRELAEKENARLKARSTAALQRSRSSSGSSVPDGSQ